MNTHLRVDVKSKSASAQDGEPPSRLARPEARSITFASAAGGSDNRVPETVLLIELVGAAVALGLLALYLAILARGVLSVVLAAAFVSILLLINFRPRPAGARARAGP